MALLPIVVDNTVVVLVETVTLAGGWGKALLGGCFPHFLEL